MRRIEQLGFVLIYLGTVAAVHAMENELPLRVSASEASEASSFVLTPQARINRSSTPPSAPTPVATPSRELRQCTPNEILERTIKAGATIAACRAESATCLTDSSNAPPCVIAKGRL